MEGFDRNKKQSIYLPIDKMSHYGAAMQAELPYSQYTFLSSTSFMIIEMNNALKKGVNHFREYCSSVCDKGYYILLEIGISFSPSCQDSLKNLVPVMRKGKVAVSDLSPRQRLLVDNLGINLANTEINISDFSNQRQILSFQYIEMLLQLGVTVDQVFTGCTALRAPIFRNIVERLIGLKHANKNRPFLKSWMKLITNRSVQWVSE